MTRPAAEPVELDLHRRQVLGGAIGAGLGPGALRVVAAAMTGGAADDAANPGPALAGLHLQFGADAATMMTVSWISLEPVAEPRVWIAPAAGDTLREVAAHTVSYRDGKSGRMAYAHHARIDGLKPDTVHVYAALHRGAAPRLATFRTAPKGRAALTFTSFGDQGSPALGRRQNADGSGAWVNDNLGSPAAADTTLGVERVAPLFHLFNGDLAYANLAQDRVRAWWDFWENNTRSAAQRPWMPSPGNHENELGNGPIGYQAYQTWFSLPPAAGQTPVTRGLWYSFTAAAVRVIALANDDVVYQDSGDSYVRGYSQGAQKAWLEAELTAARADPGIDWIVVCMHQVAISTAAKSNGADLGIREEWVPLFDRYGVDLVVCGHEHHYERSHPLRGAEANATRTPLAVSHDIEAIDTTTGTVHMVLGGGGTSSPTNGALFDPPQCRVITAVTDPDPTTGRRRPVYVLEPAAWSARRNPGHAYGFAAFRVDPGVPGGRTSIEVTYYDVTGPGGTITPFERFVLHRPRRSPI